MGLASKLPERLSATTITSTLESSPTRVSTRLILIMLVAVLLRLYGINSPLTDGGHERQTQVAMIARNLYRDGMNVLYPRLDIFAPEPGYIGLEFPLQSALMAGVYYYFDEAPWIGRSLSVLFSIGSILFFYSIAGFFLGQNLALFAVALYALSPGSIYFGRSVFPESHLLFFSLGALCFLLRWSENRKASFYFASLLFQAISILVKAPPALITLLPIGSIWWYLFGRTTLLKPTFYLYILLSILPIFAWALWTSSLGPDDPGWNAYQLSALRRWGIPHDWFNIQFYRGVFVSIFGPMLTPIGAILSVLGISCLRNHPKGIILAAWLVALGAYVFGTPGAQASHWNYQVPLIPLGAILAALGLEKSLAYFDTRAGHLGLLKGPWIRPGVWVVFILSLVAVYIPVVKRAYDAETRVPFAREVGKIVGATAPRDGFLLLVQPAMVPVTQSYYMDRKVRQIHPDPTTSLINISEVSGWLEQGAIGLVAVDTPYGSGTALLRNNPELLDFLDSTLRLIAKHPNFFIYLKKQA